MLAKLKPSLLNTGQRAALLLLSLFYAGAGLAHFVFLPGFVSITPSFVPEPTFIIAVTGVLEILGAAALYLSKLRRLAGLMLALYAICVFPANIQHALLDLGFSGAPVSDLGWLYHVPRLLAQPVLVWWALFASGWLAWPFGVKRSP